MPNMNYWSNRKEREEHAVHHTMVMEQLYKEETDDTVARSKIYSPDTKFQENEERWTETVFHLVDGGSVDVIMLLADSVYHMAVLNFASHTHPGGQFLNGSSAQEESLCHESNLYNVLSEFQDYYRENHNTRNDFMYCNRGIYSPDVRFVRGDWEVPCDVITCAAPNLAGNRKFHNVKVSLEENDRILRERCRFVLEMAKENHVEMLILGAFGCGVFGQDPERVATHFCDLLTYDFANCFKHVEFAIPVRANPENYEAFKKVLTRYGLILDFSKK